MVFVNIYLISLYLNGVKYRISKGECFDMNLNSYFLKISDRSTKKSLRKTPSYAENKEELGTIPEILSMSASPGSMEASFAHALDRVTDNLTKVIDSKISTVLEAIKKQTSQLQAIATRMNEAEKWIANVEDTATLSEAKLAQLEKQIHEMLEHKDELDNRGRRCNVRIVGLPEGTEGPDPVKFLEKWIPEYLQMDTKAGRLKLDRAHRSSAPKPGVDQHPRPLIMKFHNYADKQRVMEAARRLGPHRSNKDSPTCKESRISFFND